MEIYGAAWCVQGIKLGCAHQDYTFSELVNGVDISLLESSSDCRIRAVAAHIRGRYV
jgi:hypothetical protein